MNFLQLCQRVRQECGIAGTGPAAVTGQTGDYKRVVDWVNAAYKDIQNKWTDWKFLWAESTITLVNGTRDYTLAADCGTLNEKSLYISTDRLTYIPFKEYSEARDAWDSQSGTPTEFTILPNGKIRFFPTPNASGTVSYEYWKAAVEMSATTDSPLIPEEFHDTIWWRAKWYWAVYDEAELEAQGAAMLYDQALRRLEARQLPASREDAHSRSEGVEIVVRVE